LVAESFDFEALAASQWLKQRYQMENDCVRVSLALDPVSDAEYLHASTLAAGGTAAPAERETRGGAKAAGSAAAERRKQLRTEKSRSEHLRIEYHGKLLAAKLVDAGDGGLGAEMYVELQPGTAVAFAGELHSPFFCMKLHGRARVAHCRTRKEGVYRVGLAFEDINVRKLDCAHETGEPMPPATRRPGLTQPPENGDL
jgi:hypothetical protein